MALTMGFQRLIASYFHRNKIKYVRLELLPGIQAGCLFLGIILIIAHLFNIPAIDFHNVLLEIIQRSYRLIALSQDSPISLC